MEKSTQELWAEYCERAHKRSPASWIIVGPQTAEKLNQLKNKKQWKKKK